MQVMLCYALNRQYLQTVGTVLPGTVFLQWYQQIWTECCPVCCELWRWSSPQAEVALSMFAVQEGSLPPDREVTALANCKGSVG